LSFHTTHALSNIQYSLRARFGFKNLRLALKASYSQKEILVSSILPKNELENVDFCPSLLGQTFFDLFLGELKKPKIPFEIN
jgi:hypothetical protein